MPSKRAEQHQRQREQLADQTARAVLNEWRKVDPANVARHWRRLLPRVTAMVQAGQLTAARQTPEYLQQLLGDEDDGPQIAPEQFASQTPDGRNLTGLLSLPIPQSFRSRRKGKTDKQVKAEGASLLQRLVRTVIGDTGRQSDRVGFFANRRVTSYIRVVELPACSRCIILAGREYSMSTGFLRHPECDCTMEPVTRKHTPGHYTPEDLFERMNPAERKRVFGEAGAEAIDLGARMSSVVNARKGMTPLLMHGQVVQATWVGTGRKKNRRPPRLMPEEIFRLADGDRDHAIRLLYKNGFLR